MTRDPKCALGYGGQAREVHVSGRTRCDGLKRGIYIVPCIMQRAPEAHVYIAYFWATFKEPIETNWRSLKVVHPIFGIERAAKSEDREFVATGCESMKTGE